MESRTSILGLSGFRSGMDYRKSDAWKGLAAKHRQILVGSAQEWIVADDAIGGDPTDREAEIFYGKLLEAVPGLQVNRTQFGPMPNTRAFKIMQEFYDMLKSNGIAGDQGTGLEEVKFQLRLSAVETLLQLRNAALQEAQENHRAQQNEPSGRG